MVKKDNSILIDNHGGKAVLITQEEYATITKLPLQYIRYLCSKTCEKWRCASRIDERDLKRFSKVKVLIWYMPRNPVTGKDYPRIVERTQGLPRISRRKSLRARNPEPQ